MSTRESFVSFFGEEDATAMEAAAEEHENGLHPNRGSDPFQWVIMLTLSYECASRPEFKEYHGIIAPWEEIDRWIKEHGNLVFYDGDVDMLALIARTYDDYVERRD